MRANFHQQDGEGKLYLSTEPVNRRFWDEDGIRWGVRLTRNMPLAINIKSVASNMELDFRELKVTEFRLDVDAGNCKVAMPSSGGTTHAYIKADMANLEVTIPDEVSAKIQVDADLSAFNVDESRFPKQGDFYISDHFDTAQNRIYIKIDCDGVRIMAIGREEVVPDILAAAGL